MSTEPIQENFQDGSVRNFSVGDRDGFGMNGCVGRDLRGFQNLEGLMQVSQIERFVNHFWTRWVKCKYVSYVFFA